ncbi:LysR family transcriptional regulator [Streptomyces sp. NBC_00006]|uniref:LysR family transcriptional regulator n=1 Tax=Streptomyces sp. NBC_00006 TaxID=2975619 RepID=UPI0022540A7F|nr:LysR family transcriptional regulator [Streptomyces sp. NBC_00006]MCX5530161.1 LysR family transcriptional regulator [Streptomyces sp. NBC_00006]
MLRSDLRLEWLVSFLGVVDTGSFSAAAELTHRSQPRVSMHVAALEREAGVPLFDRDRRPVTPTDAGAVLAEHARAILRRLAGAEAAMAGYRGAARGVVTLGSYPSASVAFVPQLLERMARTRPAIKVVLVERSTLELDAALASGEVDICLRPMAPPPGPSVESRPLWWEGLIAVHPPDHLLAELPEPLPLAAVAAHPLITIGRLGSSEAMGFETYRAFSERGLEPNAVQATNQPQTLISLVRSGLGIGVTNLLAVATADTSGVVARKLDVPCGRRVAVHWSTTRPLTPPARTLLREIEASEAPPGTRDLTGETGGTGGTSRGSSKLRIPASARRA